MESSPGSISGSGYLVKSGVLDQLIEFLGDPMLQIPVKSFMDENCLIFDPSIEVDTAHRDVFTQYHQMVRSLLEGYCKDINIGYDAAVRGILHLSTAPDLREVFYEMAEPVLAATDFSVFTNAMSRHNILIQEQVLKMILASTGALPDSLTAGTPTSKTRSAAEERIQTGRSDRMDHVKSGEFSPSKSGDKSVRASEDEDENIILQQVFIKSRKDEELAQEHASDKNLAVAARRDAETLKQERSKLEEGMKKLVIESKPMTSFEPVVDVPPASRTSDKTSSTKSPDRVKTVVTSSSDKLSPAQAADNWLKSAQSENQVPSAAYSTLTASMSKMNPEELKARQEFLRQQRDKLLAMKKEEREKQLKDAERSRPQRIQSASAARQALRQSSASVKSSEDQKLAARRALAQKLRAEVVDK